MSSPTFEQVNERVAQGLCGLCGNNSFVAEGGYRKCALCSAENLTDYKCPGCQSTNGAGDKMSGCAFCGTPLMVKGYFLWYDNGTGHFDGASSHYSLSAAIKAAGDGWQTRQHITADAGGKEIVWDNYRVENTTVSVYDTTTGHKAIVGLPARLVHLIQDGFAAMRDRRCGGA